MRDINVDLCHEILLDNVKPQLAFSEDNNFPTWKKQVKEKLTQLLGLEKIRENACDANLQIESDEDEGEYRRIRFSFESEKGAFVPCYLLTPKTKKEKYPVAVCLQGHSTGFHNSIGVAKEKIDAEELSSNAYALQAVQNGFVALAIEQRGFGERRSRISYGKDNLYIERGHMCAVTAMQALSLGRTVIGERVWDVQRALDVLENFPQCDMDTVLIMGNSGGGTASFYSTCIDERIKFAIPGCSFCSYKKSILSIEHCVCNYVPSISNWFEMEDLCCLIAPRKLLVVAGVYDRIFPIDAIRDSFEVAKKIYKKAGAEDNCRLLETPNAHYWNAELIWEAIREEMKNLK